MNGKRGRGRPRINWGININNWLGMSCAGCKRTGQDRQKWRQLVACTVEHDEPTRLYDDCHNTIITYDYS